MLPESGVSRRGPAATTASDAPRGIQTPESGGPDHRTEKHSRSGARAGVAPGGRPRDEGWHHQRTTSQVRVARSPRNRHKGLTTNDQLRTTRAVYFFSLG